MWQLDLLGTVQELYIGTPEGSFLQWKVHPTKADAISTERRPFYVIYILMTLEFEGSCSLQTDERKKIFDVCGVFKNLVKNVWFVFIESILEIVEWGKTIYA